MPVTIVPETELSKNDQGDLKGYNPEGDLWVFGYGS